MEIKVVEYCLPDHALLDTPLLGVHHACWTPDRLYIVLGLSNQPEISLIAETVVSDQVPVLKRPSGGETVILSPKTLVISILERSEQLAPSRSYFGRWNRHIIAALENLGVRNLGLKGISDIAIGPKKILGCAIYRRMDSLFYHAVLNVSESAITIERYLRHPNREPDYRQGRSHTEFVTSLWQEGYPLSHYEIGQSIAEQLTDESFGGKENHGFAADDL